jgi:two-component system chemotaxis response regulator CheY
MESAFRIAQNVNETIAGGIDRWHAYFIARPRKEAPVNQMGEQFKNHPRVLVADDDRGIRHLVCTIVKRERVDADCVADGVEAIEKLRQHEYTVILLDLMMPRCDGFGVIEHLANHPQTIKPVVLVMTAYSDQRFKQVDPEIVAGVLRKPFDVAELSGIVRLCISGSPQIPERLFYSRDRAIRDFAERHGMPSHVPGRNGNGNGSGEGTAF